MKAAMRAAAGAAGRGLPDAGGAGDQPGPAGRRSTMIIGVPKQTPPVTPGPARPVPA
jgi:hypothetical protein